MFSGDDNVNFCVLPWHSLTVNTDGTSRPCCKIQTPTDGTYRFGNLLEQPIDQVWNSEGLKKLRTQFINNEKPEVCRNCWKEEAAGVRSLRQEYLHLTEKYLNSPVPVKPPSKLTLQLSNKCNLKCRICSPNLSSTFFSEAKDIGDLGSSEKLDEKNYSRTKIIDDPSKLEAFQRWATNIESIEFFGGEPMLNNENRLVEKILVENGSSEQISLLYNTNSTIFPTDAAKIWPKFKLVELQLSIDDIEDRYEYQRFPAKWENVQKNIKKYEELKTDNGNITVCFFCTVNVFNVWYMPEYLDWKSIHFPKIPLRINFLHDPFWFSITNLPKSAKDCIREKYRKSKYANSPELIQIETYLFSANDMEEYWRKFKPSVQVRDQARKQSFEKIFSEFFLACGL
jgi:radical SAM protein with 4Fe4S-binding SPASM domain